MPSTRDMYNCIEAERARKGWTIEEFAKKIGVSEKTYRKWRDENKLINCEQLRTISRTFGCSVDYLLCLSDKVKILQQEALMKKR